MTWRNSIAPIIAEVIRKTGKDDLPALRKALRDAYPYGERRMWPYKVWCMEVRRQLGHSLIARKNSVPQQSLAL